jgi:hypothetical protein
MVNEAEEARRHAVMVETTDGETFVLHYHESCFHEWLGNREHIAPASSMPNAPFVQY